MKMSTLRNQTSPFDCSINNVNLIDSMLSRIFHTVLSESVNTTTWKMHTCSRVIPCMPCLVICIATVLYVSKFDSTFEDHDAGSFTSDSRDDCGYFLTTEVNASTKSTIIRCLKTTILRNVTKKSDLRSMKQVNTLWTISAEMGGILIVTEIASVLWVISWTTRNFTHFIL